MTYTVHLGPFPTHKILILAAALLIWGSLPAVAGTVYVNVVSPSLELGELDTSNPSFMTVVGSLSTELTGLAIDGSGNLWGSDTNGDLFSVNTGTAALTLIGTGVAGVDGLAWDASMGDMLATVDPGGVTGLYTVSLSTGAMTLLTPVEGITGGDVSLAVSPSGGIYILGNTGGDWLYVDPNTLVSTPFNVTGLPPYERNAAAFVGPQLFVSLEDGTKSGLFTVDPNTGVATLVGQINVNGTGGFLGPVGMDPIQNFEIEDLAGDPPAPAVPEPSTLLLCFAGSVAIAIGARVRR
jgi:hypothetical protein